MLAAPIRIDRAVEADIRGIVAGNYLAGGIDRDRCLEGREFIETSPAVVESHPRKRLVAARGIAMGAPTFSPLVFDDDAEKFTDIVIGARRRGGQLLRRRASLG
jgi:hypothetical protein